MSTAMFPTPIFFKLFEICSPLVESPPCLTYARGKVLIPHARMALLPFEQLREIEVWREVV